MVIQFIKVAEKLPKQGSRVLGYINDVIPLDMYEFDRGEFYDSTGFICRVSWWCELPNQKKLNIYK
jgi:hypothetical protein